MSETLELLKELIARPSITPNDAGCQDIITERLEKLNFKIEKMRFEDVDNLWARHGTASPLVVFAGHTDVVPPGPLKDWKTDPFTPAEENGFVYGRGAADMKSGLAAMIVAAENFIQQNPAYSGSIAFLITSDEEGPTNANGTKRVVEELVNRGEKIDYCIVGEASSDKLLCDQIRVGRRGSLSGQLTIFGTQGHVAFPHLANNPIHSAASAILELVSTQWDRGNEFFPATSLQISNIHAGTGATNVIPGTLEISFNFRFSTAVTVDELQRRVAEIFMNKELDFDLKWHLSGLPFLTQKGKLIPAAQEVIKKATGLDTTLSTGGGTSDGRFIAPTGAEVIELGPINESIHKINEHTSIADLEKLTLIYQDILKKLF
jgi:succinyl-diaminopimelate desuccinylase